MAFSLLTYTDSPLYLYLSLPSLQTQRDWRKLNNQQFLFKDKEIEGKQSILYKSKLNEFCQKTGWRAPKYSCIKDGQDHTPLFKASVLVNGETFASQSIFKSSKSAHNDVAALALSHFTASSRELSKNSELCFPVLPEDKAMANTSLPRETTCSIKEPNSKRLMESYLISNKVRVHTCIPTTVLPNGTVMLPIGEDKWTVVSLESV